MSEYIMVEPNSRVMTGDDPIFAVSAKAKEMIAKVGKEKVSNATLGALMDDNGDLIVLSSVVDVLKGLDPVDFAEYAPISGVPGFLEASKKAVLGDVKTSLIIEAAATPGAYRVTVDLQGV